MARIYHGTVKSTNNTTYRVELWNGITADSPDGSIEIKIASADIIQQGENDTLYENRIRSTRADINFTCHKVSDNLPSADVQTNLHNIALDEEQKWAILIYSGSNLIFVGRVLSDQISYERSSAHAEIVNIVAGDALELIKNYDIDSSWFTSNKITITNLISRILKTTGLVDYWTTAGVDSRFICDATQQTATNQSGTRHLGYNQLSLISFVENYDPYVTDANIKYLDCETALNNVLNIFNARITQSAPTSTVAYWVTQSNAYDDTDFNYDVYEYNGNFVSTGNTLTHRVSIGTTARPLWEAKPIISYQPPVRKIEVEYEKQNGVFEQRGTAATGYLTTTHNDIYYAVDPDGRVKVTFDLSWVAPANTPNTRYKYVIKHYVFGRNPSTGDYYNYAPNIDIWGINPSANSFIDDLNIDLVEWGKGVGEKIFTKEYPAPPSGCTEIIAKCYLVEVQETLSVPRKNPPYTAVWGTKTITSIAFTGLIKVEQSYADGKWSYPVKTQSDFSTPRNKNSEVIKIDTSYYDGRKNDVGTVYVYNGSAYVPATAWQAPWTSTWADPTVSIQQVLAGSILALCQDFLMSIQGNWVDAGSYSSVKSLYFDSAIWIFNGGRFNLNTEQWDGEWLRITPVYENLNNNGEGVKIQTDKVDRMGDKVDILLGEVSRLSGGLGAIGGVIIGDIINNASGAPTSNPGADKEYIIGIKYDYTAETVQWKIREYAATGEPPTIYSKTFADSPYTITKTTGEVFVFVDATSGNCTVNLPTAVSNTAKYTIKKTDSSANTVTIDGSGVQTIDGSLTAIILVQNIALQLISNNTNFYVV